jgi:tetratricopeptide (TPR) repeat protein
LIKTIDNMSCSFTEIGYKKGLLPHLLFLLFISNSLFGSLQIGVDTIDIMHPLDSLEPKMRRLNSLGFQYYQDGDFFKADSVWTISLHINRRLYTDSDEESNIAENYVNLGVANLKLWNYEYALELFDKAEKIFQKFDEANIHLGAIYVNKAIIFNALRDFDIALLYFEQAIDLYKNQDIISYESLYRSYRNLANLYSFTNRFTEAIECIETGILYDKSKSTSRLIDYFNMIAYYHSKLGNYESAESFYNNPPGKASLGQNHSAY